MNTKPVDGELYRPYEQHDVETTEAQKAALLDLKEFFRDLGIYVDASYDNEKLIVFVGKSLHNRIGYMVFYYDWVVTSWGKETGDRFSGHVHTNIVAENRKDGKKIAIKDAVTNDCVDITDQYGNTKDGMRWKFDVSVEETSKVVDNATSNVANVLGASQK